MDHEQRIFWSLFLAVFSAMIGVAVLTPFLPLLGQKFGASATELGILVSAFSISRIFGMPVAGKLSDRYGRRRFILIGLLGYSLLSFAYLSSDSVLEFTIVRLLHGLAAALVVPLAIATVADTAAEGQEGTVVGSFSVSIGAGWGLGPMIGGFLLDRYGFDATFYFMGALTGLALFLALLFIPRGGSTAAKKPPVPYREMLKDPQVATLAAYRVTSVTGRSLLTAFLPLYTVSKAGLSPTETGVIISAMVLSMSALQPLFGRLADRTSRRSLLQWSAVTSAIFMALMPFTQGFWPILAIVMCYGFTHEMGSVASTAMVVVEGRKFGMGSSIALFSTALSAGMIAGPLVGGLGEDFLGDGASFWTAGTLVFAGAFLSGRLQESDEPANTTALADEA